MCLFSLSVGEKVRKVIKRKETDFNAAIKSDKKMFEGKFRRHDVLDGRNTGLMSVSRPGRRFYEEVKMTIAADVRTVLIDIRGKFPFYKLKEMQRRRHILKRLR